MRKRILRKPEVRAITGLADSTQRLMTSRGEFPRQILLGARSVGHDSESVDLWVRARAAGCSIAEMRALVAKLNAGDALDEIRKLTSNISLASSTAEIRELVGRLTAPPRATARIQDLKEQLDAARPT